MKKYLFASLLLLGFAGCVKDDTCDNVQISKGVNMSFAIDDEQSRTTLAEGRFVWKDGDKVGVFVDNAATPTVNAEGTVTVKDGVANVDFKAEAFAAGDVVSAYYPYDATVKDKTAVRFTLPTTQIQSAAGEYNGFCHPMIGVSKAFATATGESINFRPTCAVVQYNIFTSNPAYEGEKVQKVLFRSGSHTSTARLVSGWPLFDITKVTEEDEPVATKLGTFTKKTGETNEYPYGQSWLSEVVFENPLEVSASRQQAYVTWFPGEYAGFFVVLTDKAEYMYIYHAEPAMNGDEIDFSEEPTVDGTTYQPFERNTIHQIPLDLGSTARLVNRKEHTPRTDFTTLRRNLANYSDRGANRIIKCVAISDKDEKNSEYNPQTAYNKINTSESENTGYIEQIDGKYGFRVKFASAEDNVFHKGDELVINLSGTEIKEETNATGTKSYTIYELSKRNILSQTSGTIPSKVKTIAELTDDDIYTYTSLSDMEFVFKQGAYTNVDESYVLKSELNTSSAAKGYGDCATRLMQDKSGDAIYMQINTLCQWRRKLDVSAAGNHGVPQGVGKLNGVVVSNINTHSGDIDGFIGKYSIRPIDESDVAGENAIPWASSSARTTIAAWNFDNGVANSQIRQKDSDGMIPGTPYLWKGTNTGDNEYLNYNGNSKAMNRMLATDGDESATLFCDNLELATDNLKTSLYSVMIGWRPHFADGFESEYVYGGLGLIAGDCWYCPTSEWSGFPGGTSSTGTKVASRKFRHRGGCNALGDYIWVTNLTGWYDWNEDGATYSGTKGFNIDLSTASATGPVTINFSMGAGGNSCTDWSTYINEKKENNYNNFFNFIDGYYTQNYPLNWKVQYSTDGGATWNDGAVDAVTGADKFVLRPMPCLQTGKDCPVYYTPATTTTQGNGSYPSMYMSLGLSEYSFVLPADASGKAEVRIRITPADAKVGSRFSGTGNYKLKLDYKGNVASKDASYGNIIHFGGIQIQY